MTYTHGHHESVLRGHRARTAANSAAYLLPHLSPDLRLLDIGCGPGTITADLAGRVAHVTAVEVSAEVLELAREELSDSDVELVVADVHGLAFADDSFDVVHAHQVLQHVADPVQALREMKRVCRPGGVVAVRDADYASFNWWPELPGLDRWMQLYQGAALANGGQPQAGRRLRAWAHAAGFERVTTSASTWCFATPDERAAWGGMWADRITSSALARQLEQSGVPPEELEEISHAWRTWTTDPDGVITIVHGEVLAHA